MGFYTLSHGKFDDREYSRILYGINSIDIMGCCTPKHSVPQSHGNYTVLLPWLGDINMININVPDYGMIYKPIS